MTLIDTKPQNSVVGSQQTPYIISHMNSVEDDRGGGREVEKHQQSSTQPIVSIAKCVYIKS
jgi:hypothetical protein